jgi:predicted peroxiredoxin
MAKILVHLTHGSEHPTRAALAFLVAKSAIEEGHSVSMFLVGDAVQLIRDGVLDNLTGFWVQESYGLILIRLYQEVGVSTFPVCRAKGGV